MMNTNDDIENYAKILKELGHPARLGVYKRLVKAGENGLPVGDLQKELKIPGSTLSHHLSALMSVGLIRQVREGRTLFCIPRITLFQQLLGFLHDECCSDGTKVHVDNSGLDEPGASTGPSSNSSSSPK